MLTVACRRYNLIIPWKEELRSPISFTEELLEVAEPIWATIIDQPIVVELGAGTLERNPIRYWVKQVYVYLNT
ncbi:hypothetical protein [Natronomonas amylolytica]|uniref:hypothetical protein n=1 Tax=Natronomonas amylolytica TaxID=3108498 RepID=UPI00300A47A3